MRGRRRAGHCGPLGISTIALVSKDRLGCGRRAWHGRRRARPSWRPRSARTCARGRTRRSAPRAGPAPPAGGGTVRPLCSGGLGCPAMQTRTQGLIRVCHCATARWLGLPEAPAFRHAAERLQLAGHPQVNSEPAGTSAGATSRPTASSCARSAAAAVVRLVPGRGMAAHAGDQLRDPVLDAAAPGRHTERAVWRRCRAAAAAAALRARPGATHRAPHASGPPGPQHHPSVCSVLGTQPLQTTENRVHRKHCGLCGALLLAVIRVSPARGSWCSGIAPIPLQAH